MLSYLYIICIFSYSSYFFSVSVVSVVPIVWFRSFRWFRFLVPVVTVVPVVPFRWFRWFRSGVPGFITCQIFVQAQISYEYCSVNVYVLYHTINVMKYPQINECNASQVTEVMVTLGNGGYFS